MNTNFISMLVAVGLSMAAPAFADDAAKRPDNTGKNKVESPTADQSGNAKSDVQITADIRRAIMKDDALSTSAHNVKIIVESGMVTLKGPVKNAAEKTNVATKATNVVGMKNVKNQLEIAP